jgi:hypothetical protein
MTKVAQARSKESLLKEERGVSGPVGYTKVAPRKRMGEFTRDNAELDGSPEFSIKILQLKKLVYIIFIEFAKNEL